jgi:anti-sigma28 factor (negative regulator of flagellin synthesis)
MLESRKEHCLWSNLRASYAKMGSRVSEMTMNRKDIPDGVEMIPEGRKDKLAMLKKAITEGTYKVQAEDMAEKMLKELLLELALTHREYRI